MAMRRAAWLLLALAPMADALIAPSARTASRRAALRASRSDRKYRWIEKEYSKAAAEEWLQAQARDASKYDSKRAAAFGAEAGEEYDLEYALAANTDDTITKIIVGALTVTLVGLLRGSGGRFGGIPAVGSAAATPRRYVAVLRPILEPASFTAADGSVYVMEGGSFVEQ